MLPVQFDADPSRFIQTSGGGRKKKDASPSLPERSLPASGSPPTTNSQQPTTAHGLFDRFIFFPEAVLVASPAAVGLSHEEAVFAAADGARLHGWYVPGRRSETLLWFHGNAGNVSHRLDNLRLCTRWSG